LWKITEPGGRFLQISYASIWLNGNIYRTMIDFVQSHDGRGNVMQTVDYTYQRLIFHDSPLLYLTRVDYDMELTPLIPIRKGMQAKHPILLLRDWFGPVMTCVSPAP
jgi:hypothetical protein